MAAKPCIKVVDGIAFDHRGERIAPVKAENGYYSDTIDRMGIIDGEWVKGKKPPELTGILSTRDCYFFPCYTTSTYPTLIHSETGGEIGAGEIDPPLPVGSYVDIIQTINYRTGRATYYYHAPNGKTPVNPVELIQRWWLRFPYDLPWVTDSKTKKTSLDPNLIKWIKEYKFKPLEVILTRKCDASMVKPDSLCEQISKGAARQLAFIRGKLNTQLAPIGAEVTKIVPTWARGIALCHVWFVVDGVDPTHGQGCMVYKNGMFYYGPYCQRIGQEGTDMFGVYIHQAPPIYTMASWISGPLYSTQHKMADLYGASKAKSFKVSKVTQYLPGTRRPDLSDVEGIHVVTARQIEDAANKIGIELTAARLAELAAAFNKGQKSSYFSTALANEKRYAVTNIYRSDFVLGMYLSDMEGKWRYVIDYREMKTYDDRNFIRTSLIADFDPDSQTWGLPRPSRPTLSESSIYETNMPILDCKCRYCVRVRRDVTTIYKMVMNKDILEGYRCQR